MTEANKVITPERAREIIDKTAPKKSGLTNWLDTPILKGVNWHEFGGKKFDVDTFYDELYWEQIFPVRGKPRYRVWRYGKDYGICPVYDKAEDLQFNIQRTGVFMKCQWCNVTIPAPPFNIDDLGAEPEETKAAKIIDEDIEMEFAQKVLQRTGAPSPFPQIRPHNRRQELKSLKDVKA